MPNKVIFSRIQNRRGPLENLPQPLRPGEIALTSDARRVWIGNEDVAPFGIRTLTPAVPVLSGSLIDLALTTKIVSMVFDADLTQQLYDQLVDYLSRENNELFPPFVPPSKTILITNQDQTAYSGSFSGGSGHNTGDVITLINGARIEVIAESAGEVTEFVVEYRGGVAEEGVTYPQQSTTGTGTDFSITPQSGNLTTPESPDKATFYNASQQVLWDQKRSVFIGLRLPELQLAAEKNPNWLTDPALALEETLDGLLTNFPVDLQSQNIKIAEDEFVADWQGPATSAKIRNFSNPLLTSQASGNVARLINLVSSSSVVLDDSQTQADYNSIGSNGSFTPGSNYSVGDVIIMQNGAVIEVDSVDNGGVEEFTITARGSQVIPGLPISQSSVTSSGGTPSPGENFTLTPQDNNIVLIVSDEILSLVTTVSNIEIGVVDIFDETEFPSDIVFQQFEYETVLDQSSASPITTGIEFPALQSDSVFIEYTVRNDDYAAIGNMKLSLFGSAVSISDQRNENTTLGGDLQLSADFSNVGQAIRVLYTNTLSPPANDLILKMVVRRWDSGVLSS